MVGPISGPCSSRMAVHLECRAFLRWAVKCERLRKLGGVSCRSRTRWDLRNPASQPCTSVGSRCRSLHQLQFRCPPGQLDRLTNRWSGRVKDKVPTSDVGARAAQLKR
jgi:hypothetical protein